MAEIKNFEGLEKALGELMLERGTGPFHEEINYYNVLGLVNSLKAGLKKDLDIVKQCKIYAERGSWAGIDELIEDRKQCKKCSLFVVCCENIDKLLRRLLEGEGGEKEKGAE